MTTALLQRLACRVTGHWWDSDRPKRPARLLPGPLLALSRHPALPGTETQPARMPRDRKDRPAMTRIDSGLSIRYIPHGGGLITVHDATVVSDLPDPEVQFTIGTPDDPAFIDAQWHGAFLTVAVSDVQNRALRALVADEARDLAAWLLAAAHHIDTKEDPDD